jgi:long-chain acyl-CoA synthetase
MNDKNWPALSLDDAHARLTAPCMPFETVETVVRGVPMRVWKNVPATAAQLFAQARAHGGREFLVYEDDRIGFDAFARATAHVAALLAARGLKKGERVALAMRNLPQWPVVFMGALLAGGIAVPLNGWWTSSELAFALQDCKARFVFGDDEQVLRLTDLPDCVETVFTLEALGAVIGAPASWKDLPDIALPDMALNPEDDATIFYTSGTTSAPRGALGTHRSLTTNIFAAPFVVARNALRRGVSVPPSPASEATSGGGGRSWPSGQRRPEGEKQRVTLLAVPFFHVVGSLSVLLPNMAAGGKLVLMRKFDAAQAAHLIAREKVTVAGGVPAIALALLEQRGDFSSLELVTFGGAPSPVSLARRIREALGAMPGQGWGMTETSATCTTHSAEDYLHRPDSCGPALPVSRVRILKDGRDAPPGIVGEVWAFGPNIMKGYWNRPDATAQSLVDGWLKTGDLGSLDAEGFLTIADRSQDMLIRGGENIYCIEVENILAQHPGVADAALVGLAHPWLGEVPAALVQARPGMEVSEQGLQDFARARLAAFKVPVRILVSHEPLARNAGGKLVKSVLRKAFA